MDIVTARDIQAALLRKGYSCRSWAIENGYYPRTVQKCIQRHAPDQNKKVQGKKYLAIMKKLSKCLGLNEKDFLGGHDD
ncbi:hypothetical protein L1D34_07100 [Vibrio mediterranei]|uniref:hypothetical protein n=1 Tax=Vibrio mediterranei TaxID=689 RepID=UPI001EFE5583|nr:hypothetical protein [Vibrio mediterranei]MCG9624605.1 hypothetical protein [Vibrio mediterranei]